MILFFIISTGCDASTIVQLPLIGTTTIVGPFPPEPMAATFGNPAYYVPVQIEINYNGKLPPVPPWLPSNNQSDFEVFVSVSGGEGYFVATDVSEHNQPGPGGCIDCQLAQSSDALNPNHVLLLTQDSYEISTSASFVNEYGYDPGAPLEDFFSITATLPDGFSVAAVPEISTWAMLLIGFAGIGFVSWRRRAVARIWRARLPAEDAGTCPRSDTAGTIAEFSDQRSNPPSPGASEAFRLGLLSSPAPKPVPAASSCAIVKASTAFHKRSVSVMDFWSARSFSDLALCSDGLNPLDDRRSLFENLSRSAGGGMVSRSSNSPRP
jgi:hypothetical protein